MSVAYDLLSVADGAENDVEPNGLSRPACPRVEPRLFLVPPPAAPVPARRRASSASPAFDAPSLSGVAVLQSPVDSPPVRLTRRGIVAVAFATALLAVTLVVLAALSAHAAGAGDTQVSSGGGPAVVTVHPGDTLWSIASAAAPGVDPRAEVATIARLNHLSGESLAPGQRLRLR